MQRSEAEKSGCFTDDKKCGGIRVDIFIADYDEGRNLR
jgi:hypothetical protein